MQISARKLARGDYKVRLRAAGARSTLTARRL
jgi:hypothetical protein